MYKNFIFDLYGTLIDIRTDEQSNAVWEKYAAWLKTEGISYRGKKLKKIYEQGCEEQFRNMKSQGIYEYPEPDVLPVFAGICRRKNRKYTDGQVYRAAERFRILSTGFMELYPNTINVLEELRKAGRKIYLLSNAQRVFTWQELVKTGLIYYFDDIFISSDMGCKKPDKAFFDKLIDKHALNVSESVMIGNDSTSDIAGATAVGMDAVYISTAISPENDPVPDCRYVFEDGDIGHVLELL